MWRKKNTRIEGETFLTTVNNQIQLDIIQSLLSSYDIPIYIRDELSGGFIRILMGSSYFDADIYVSEKDYETARAVIFGTIQPDDKNL
jgi:hypothetical protein